jgi:hypothetical protein
MAPLPTITFPLTLSEQLDAMLSGWLDRHDPDGGRRGADRVARAVITVARSAVPEFEAFCERRGLRLLRSTPAGLQSAVLVVEGEPLPIQGLAHITALYRR